MNQNGMKFFEAIGRLPENLVTESESICGYYDHPVKEKRSRRPAWLTDGVIAAAVCVLIGIVTYVGILTFMSGGFQNWVAGIFNSEQTTEEDTTEDVKVSKDLEFRSLGDGKCEVASIGSCTDTSIVIPSVSPDGESVMGIGEYAFIDCASITDIIIPDSVTRIGKGAFEGCSELIRKENGVSYVDKWVIGFDGESTEVTLDPDAVGIGDYAFVNCSGIEKITIPDGVMNIGIYAFSDCVYLKEITLPAGITEIKTGVFKGCIRLNTITIPDNVTSIGTYAFRGCSDLEFVFLSESLTEIKLGAFFSCSSLSSIHYEGTAEKWRGIKKGDYWNDETSRYILYCSDFPRPKEVDYLTEEKLNGYSELILHPKDGKTLYVDFGMYAFNRLIGKNSRFNKSGPDEYIGWLFDHNVKSIPVTPIVKFEPGIVNDKSVLPNGWVVLSENGVEFAGGYLIYHAADLIFDASFKPERIENGMVYGTMIDYLNGGGFIPVKFKAPEEKVIFQPDIYDFSISDVLMMPQYTIDELIKLDYYLVIKDVSLVNLKKLPYDGDTYDITEILPDELIYDNRIIVY